MAKARYCVVSAWGITIDDVRPVDDMTDWSGYRLDIISVHDNLADAMTASIKSQEQSALESEAGVFFVAEFISVVEATKKYEVKLIAS